MADRGTQTGGSSGGRGGGIPLGAGSQTIKGGLLVLAAVVLGIVLLQVVDPGKTGPVAQHPTATTKPAVTTTTTKKPGKTTPTTKAGTTAVKPPALVKLLVLNAGAPTGSAKSVSTALKNKGYTFQGTPANDPNKRSVSEVLCTAGLTREGAALAVLLGKGTTHGTIGNPAPLGSSGFDCVVLVGAQGVK